MSLDGGYLCRRCRGTFTDTQGITPRCVLCGAWFDGATPVCVEVMRVPPRWVRSRDG